MRLVFSIDLAHAAGADGREDLYGPSRVPDCSVTDEGVGIIPVRLQTLAGIRRRGMPDDCVSTMLLPSCLPAFPPFLPSRLPAFPPSCLPAFPPSLPYLPYNESPCDVPCRSA